MAMSRLTRWLTNRGRPGRAKADPRRFRPAVEPLDGRVLPAVAATFSAAGGTLTVVGDGLDNTVVVSRTAAGTILVNNGAVVIAGGTATVTNTRLIVVNGGAGNDALSLDEANGPMPAASISGGDGNDTITGGSGNDFVDGGPGNDTAFLGGGDDTFQWDPGDGSDTLDGQGGFDTLVFNGSDLAEQFGVSANGSRVRLTRDLGGVAMDVNGVEQLDLNPLGGADTVTVNDLTPTDLFQVNVNLASSAGTGDGQPDAVVVNGTNGGDAIQIGAFSNPASIVVGDLSKVDITGAEGANDTLTVNALGGDDTVDASNLTAGLIGLTVNGGAGNDTILGSQGNDLVTGGPGADTVLLGAGDDTFVWAAGDGNDTIDGQAGNDKLTFTGSDLAETVAVSRDGSRVRLSDDAGNVTLDLNAIEGIEINALGGADAITVNDLTGTGLVKVQVNLGGPAGGGDGQPDNVIVNGTNDDDAVRVAAAGNTVLVDGLFPVVRITGAEGATDRLTVNTLGGNDTVDSSGLPAGLIGLTVDLGDGQTAPGVAGVAVNDGSAQRSVVRSLTVTFSGPVTFLGGGSNAAAAFRLARTGPNGATADVTLAATVSTDAQGRTVVTLTFSGPFTETNTAAGANPSLIDGSYRLTVLGSNVTGADGVALDGDGNGTPGGDNVFVTHRLFGDVDGDGDVDLLDLSQIVGALFSTQGQQGPPTYNPALDFEGDGDVDLLDLSQFTQRLFTVLP